MAAGEATYEDDGEASEELLEEDWVDFPEERKREKKFDETSKLEANERLVDFDERIPKYDVVRTNLDCDRGKSRPGCRPTS